MLAPLVPRPYPVRPSRTARTLAQRQRAHGRPQRATPAQVEAVHLLAHGQASGDVNEFRAFKRRNGGTAYEVKLTIDPDDPADMERLRALVAEPLAREGVTA